MSQKPRNPPCCNQATLLIRRVISKINYFGDNSSLHGFGHVFSAFHIPFYKRIFFFSMLVLCFLGAYLILRAVLLIYGRAVSYTIETTYLDFNTPFPAVTVCEKNDQNRYTPFLLRHKLPLEMKQFYMDVTFWNKDYCKTCSKCVVNKTCLEDVLDIAMEYRFKCEDMLAECWWDGKPFPCCERFLPVQTEFGLCFSFNSRINSNDSIQTVNHRALPSLTITALEWIVLRIHSPDEVINVASENVLGAESQSNIAVVSDFDILINAEQTVNDKSVTDLPPEVRGCYMPWETPPYALHWPYKIYTYEACVWYCRTMAQIEHCNCTHHFMQVIDGYNVCDVQGLACLNKNKKQLLEKSCVCPAECEEVRYKLINFYKKRLIGDAATNEMLARGSRGRIKFLTAPTVRVKRQAIRDMLSLVVDIGGVGGVFFGASLLGLIEIVYLFCIRK